MDWAHRRTAGKKPPFFKKHPQSTISILCVVNITNVEYEEQNPNEEKFAETCHQINLVTPHPTDPVSCSFKNCQQQLFGQFHYRYKRHQFSEMKIRTQNHSAKMSQTIRSKFETNTHSCQILRFIRWQTKQRVTVKDLRSEQSSDFARSSHRADLLRQGTAKVQMWQKNTCSIAEPQIEEFSLTYF